MHWLLEKQLKFTVVLGLALQLPSTINKRASFSLTIKTLPSMHAKLFIIISLCVISCQNIDRGLMQQLKDFQESIIEENDNGLAALRVETLSRYQLITEANGIDSFLLAQKMKVDSLYALDSAFLYAPVVMQQQKVQELIDKYSTGQAATDDIRPTLTKLKKEYTQKQFALRNLKEEIYTLNQGLTDKSNSKSH
jgi:hypothetical protein